MSDQSSTTKKLQWKWVGITLLMYLIFYPLPIIIARYALATKPADIFIGAWLFAGIIIIGAVAGFLSKEVTLWEPAIASVGFIGLFIIAMLIPPGGLAGLTLLQSVMQLILVVVIFFIFSLLGAWIGERAQKLWKPKSSQ